MIRLDAVPRRRDRFDVVMSFPHARIAVPGLGVLESFFEAVDFVAEVVGAFCGFAGAELLLEELERGEDGAEWHGQTQSGGSYFQRLIQKLVRRLFYLQSRGGEAHWIEIESVQALRIHRMVVNLRWRKICFRVVSPELGFDKRRGRQRGGQVAGGGAFGGYESRVFKSRIVCFGLRSLFHILPIHITSSITMSDSIVLNIEARLSTEP